MKRYIMGNARNMRDLGGYPADGGYTQFGRFIRCDAPLGFTEADLQRLLDMGITTIVDMRGEAELERNPTGFAEDARFSYRHLYLKDDPYAIKCADDVAVQYFKMLDSQTGMCAILRAIAAAEGGVLFHCSAGKDRTGCTAALLLELAGVAEVDIIADYQVTATYLRPITERIFAALPGVSECFTRSDPEFIEGLLRLLHEKYGTARDYMLAIGMTEAEISTIRDKLLK